MATDEKIYRVIYEYIGIISEMKKYVDVYNVAEINFLVAFGRIQSETLTNIILIGY